MSISISFTLILGMFFSLISTQSTQAFFTDDEPIIPGHISSERFKEISDLTIPEKQQSPPHDLNNPTIFNDTVVEIIEQLDQTILLKYLDNLTAFGPRVTESQACIDAADYIYQQFVGMGLQVRYQNWTNEGYIGSNIEATLTPQDPENDEIYLICGHYDSVQTSPGADDDGSGVVIALAAAEILSQYTVNKTVRFVAFSGEEQGLLGSQIYAQEAATNGDHIVAVLNADMIGFALSQTDGEKIKIYADNPSLWITTYMENVSQTYNQYIGLTLIPSGTSSGSDHYYFWMNGYYAIFEHEFNFNDYYHSSEDTIAHMNLTYSVKTSRLLLATLAVFLETGSSPPPLPPVLEVTEISGGKGITIVITNVGFSNATDVSYMINITGGLYLSKRSDAGTLGSLVKDQSATTTFLFKGIGLGILSAIPTITVTATCAEDVSTVRAVHAKVFFGQVTVI
jgi:hypothetical protein